MPDFSRCLRHICELIWCAHCELKIQAVKLQYVNVCKISVLELSRMRHYVRWIREGNGRFLQAFQKLGWQQILRLDSFHTILGIVLSFEKCWGSNPLLTVPASLIIYIIVNNIFWRFFKPPIRPLVKFRKKSKETLKRFIRPIFLEFVCVGGSSRARTNLPAREIWTRIRRLKTFLGCLAPTRNWQEIGCGAWTKKQRRYECAVQCSLCIMQ